MREQSNFVFLPELHVAIKYQQPHLKTLFITPVFNMIPPTREKVRIMDSFYLRNVGDQWENCSKVVGLIGTNNLGE